MPTFTFLIILTLWSTVWSDFTPIPLDYVPEYTTALAIKQGLDNYTNPIAIGETNYTKFIQNSKMFIDNSLLIKEFLTIYPPWSILYLGPRKYGKTINLDMLKTFFEMIIDEDGDKITPQKITPTHRLFRRGIITMEDGTTERLENPLLISREAELVDKWQGRYPIVYLNFENTIGDNLTDIKTKLWHEIRKEYERHKYVRKRLLEDPDKDTPGVRSNYENYQKILELRHEDWYLPYAVKFLCEMLHLFYVRITFVLIDNYDAPFQHALRSNFPESDVRVIADLLDRITRETYKSRAQFVRGIVVGRLPIHHYRWDDNWILNAADTGRRSLQNYFGICKKDLNLLFTELNITKDLYRRAHPWYKMHRCDTIKQDFYSPWSIANFVRTRQIASYWYPHQNDHFIQTHLHKDPAKRTLLLKILSNQTLDTGNALYCCEKNKLIDINRIPDFSAFLAYEGYLSRNITYTPNGFKAKLNHFTAQLANLETAFQMSNWLISYCRQQYHVDEAHLKKSAAALAESITKDLDDASLAQTLQSLYNSITSSDKTENTGDSLHFIFECVALRMQCDSNFEIQVYYRNTKEGDIVVFDTNSRHGAIIEVETHCNSADGALTRAQMYKTILWQFGKVKKMKFFGINISSDKTVQVKTTQELL